MEEGLFFGDNLDVLREHVKTASVDTVYLDPPFNSQAKYNILFKSAISERETAQAEAFRDTWLWDQAAERDFHSIMRFGGPVAGLISALRLALKDSDMMAYLVMMTVYDDGKADRITPRRKKR